MKVKLYKKLVKKACKWLGVSRSSLFSRDFSDMVTHIYRFSIFQKYFVRLPDEIAVVSTHHPISQMWQASDSSTSWLLRYWKHSRHRELIQVKLDLGECLEDILIEILNSKNSNKHIQ